MFFSARTSFLYHLNCCLGSGLLMAMVVWIQFISGFGAHLGFCFLKDRQLPCSVSSLMARIVLVPISWTEEPLNRELSGAQVWVWDLISYPSNPSLIYDIWIQLFLGALQFWCLIILLWIWVPSFLSVVSLSLAFCYVFKNIIHYILSRITVFGVSWGLSLHVSKCIFLTCAVH